MFFLKKSDNILSMSTSNGKGKFRKDTNYNGDHFHYINRVAKKRQVAFTQVVREILDIGIPLHKNRKGLGRDNKA